MIHEANQFGVAVDQFTDRRLVLAGVFAQGKGDVVVEIHGTEKRTILEEDAELLAYLVQSLLP